MKLDPRIYPAKRPLTCFDTEEAKQFIGKTGFFTDKLEQFCDLDKLPKTELRKVWQNETYCFFTSLTRHKYFLPCEWVQEQKEPEWRPFSLTEWRYDYAIGDEIVFRIKSSDTVRAFMFCGLFSDHDDDVPGKGVISLGSELFVLQNLFDQFELRKNNEWQPFGVIDEDKEQIK